MDCEKFDSHVIDALYDELDELTSAAMKRHMESCSRCANVFAGLRATREVGIVPIEEPSDDLEDRILEAAFVAQKTTPWPRKLLRGLAWAGSHAMRPQLAMAALFFLVIGSSLLLLRAKPGSVAVVPVRVTEHGAPSEDDEPRTAMNAPAPAATAEAALGNANAAPADEVRGRAAAREEGKAVDAIASKDAEKKEANGDDGAVDPARAALAEARATKDSSGCAAAIPKLDAVGSRFPGTGAAADAMWEEASCYKSNGDSSKARDLFLALRGSPAYRDRAEREIAGDASGNVAKNNVAQQQVANASPPPAPPAAAANAAPSSSSAELEAARAAKTKETTIGGKAAAAPARPAPKAAAKTDAAF